MRVAVQTIRDFEWRIVGLGGTTASLGLVLEGFRSFSDLFGLVARACLGSTTTFAADCAIFFFLLVFVTSFRIGVSVIRPGMGLESVWVVAIIRRHPGNMRFQPFSSHSYSAFGALISPYARHEGWMRRTHATFNIFHLCNASLATFYVTQSRYLNVLFPPHLQHLIHTCETEHSPG